MNSVKAPFGEELLKTMAAYEDTANPKVEWRYGACHACMGSPCLIRAKVVDGRVVKVEGQKIKELRTM